MKKLDAKDIGRYSWEKMAPGIEGKIKEKKRRFYFFRFFKFGALPLLLLIGFVLFSVYNNPHVLSESVISEALNSKSLEVKKFEENISDATTKLQFEDKDAVSSELASITSSSDLSKPSLNPSTSANYNSSSAQDTSANQMSTFAEAQEMKILQIQETKFAEAHQSKFVKAEETKLSYQRTQADVINDSSNNLDLKKFVGDEMRIQNAKTKSKEGSGIMESMTNLTDIMEVQNRTIKTLDGVDVSSADLVSKIQRLSINLKSKPRAPYANQSITIDTSIERRTKAIEFAVNTNSFINYPHTSKLGTGITFGYWVSIRGPHYIGFEYSYQKYRHRFMFPEEIFELNGKVFSDNSHTFYQLPIFYGIQVDYCETVFSIEAGINLTFSRFAKGEISSPSNRLAIIKLEDGNYFADELGASILLRAKVSRSLGGSYRMFARAGTNFSASNWYKNDSNELKPIIFNVDFGVAKLF